MISSTKKTDDKLARKAAGRWRHRNKANKIMAWRVAGTRLTSANQIFTLQIHPTDHTTAWMIGKWARFGDKYLIMRQVSCRKYRLLEYFFYVLLHLHCHCSQYVLCIDKHWQSLVSYSGEFRPFGSSGLVDAAIYWSAASVYWRATAHQCIDRAAINILTLPTNCACYENWSRQFSDSQLI